MSPHALQLGVKMVVRLPSGVVVCTLGTEGGGMTAFKSVEEGQMAPLAPVTGVSPAGPVAPPSQSPSSPVSQKHDSPFGAAGRVDPDFYQAAVLHAGIPVVPLDVTGRILSWNAAAVRLFGRNESEVQGQHIDFLIPDRKSTV